MLALLGTGTCPHLAACLEVELLDATMYCIAWFGGSPRYQSMMTAHKFRTLACTLGPDAAVLKSTDGLRGHFRVDPVVLKASIAAEVRRDWERIEKVLFRHMHTPCCCCGRDTVCLFAVCLCVLYAAVAVLCFSAPVNDCLSFVDVCGDAEKEA